MRSLISLVSASVRLRIGAISDTPSTSSSRPPFTSGTTGTTPSGFGSVLVAVQACEGIAAQSTTCASDAYRVTRSGSNRTAWPLP